MRYFIITTALFSMLFGSGAAPRMESRDSFETEPLAQSTKQIKWPRRTIEISFSNSLLAPGPQIKAGSDVTGAVRRALARWSNIANLNFVVTWSSEQSVSPADRGDGISLITIADTPENDAFNSASTTGRTRVFFDPENGVITEADISINPHPHSDSGAEVQFSTDGTPGTYDLEATFTHEIGHLLGLDHSSVLASTMQSHQGFNGMFGLPAYIERTLSEDDRQHIRSLYGTKQPVGRIEGRLTDGVANAPSARLTVFAESVATGRVVASALTESDGSFAMPDLNPGLYRIFAEPRTENSLSRANSIADQLVALDKSIRSIELSSQVAIKSDEPSVLNYDLNSSQATKPQLDPRWLGMNRELSTVALPLQAGKRIKIFLGGQGIDQVPGVGITLNSPYFKVDPASLSKEELGTSFPVISFDVSVAPNAPFGDYSLRLESSSGELAHLPGAITIDPGAAVVGVAPLDDLKFFLFQQFADVLGRDPDKGVIASFVSQVSQCGARAECVRNKQLELSTSLLSQHGLVEEVGLLNDLYTIGLGRRVRLSEFDHVRSQQTRVQNDEASRLAAIVSFVQSEEFQTKYPATLAASAFVDAILIGALQKTGADVSNMREQLLPLFDGTNLGRATILSSVLNDKRFVDARYNQAFVLAQYFTLLRRDPDVAGFEGWLENTKTKSLRDVGPARTLTCQFLNSDEYQLRFGMVISHSPAECN